LRNLAAFGRVGLVSNFLKAAIRLSYDLALWHLPATHHKFFENGSPTSWRTRNGNVRDQRALEAAVPA
jgi:hypothetical protein